MNACLVPSIRVLQLRATPPGIDSVAAGGVDVEGVPTHGHDGVLVRVAHAQQPQLGGPVRVECVAHHGDDQVLLPPLDVPNHRRYIGADQSQGPVWREYLASLSHGGSGEGTMWRRRVFTS